MKTSPYSEEFKEKALCKVYQRNGRTIKAIADELNLPTTQDAKRLLIPIQLEGMGPMVWKFCL